MSGPRVRNTAVHFFGERRERLNVLRLDGVTVTEVRTPEEAVELIVQDNVEAGKRLGLRVVARIEWSNCPKGFRAPEPKRGIVMP